MKRRTASAFTIFLAIITISDAAFDVFSCFTFYPNRYLEKSGSVFLGDLKNATDCIARCLTAKTKHGIVCKSAMWKRDTEDCVLSKYDRDERFDYYQIAPNLEIDLYENRCLNTQGVDVNDNDVVVSDSIDDLRTTVKMTEMTTDAPTLNRKTRYQPDPDPSTIGEKSAIHDAVVNIHGDRTTEKPLNTVFTTPTPTTTRWMTTPALPTTLVVSGSGPEVGERHRTSHMMRAQTFVTARPTQYDPFPVGKPQKQTARPPVARMFPVMSDTPQQRQQWKSSERDSRFQPIANVILHQPTVQSVSNSGRRYGKAAPQLPPPLQPHPFHNTSHPLRVQQGGAVERTSEQRPPMMAPMMQRQQAEVFHPSAVSNNNLRGSRLYSADSGGDKEIIQRDFFAQTNGKFIQSQGSQQFVHPTSITTTTPPPARVPIRPGPITTHFYRPPTTTFIPPQTSMLFNNQNVRPMQPLPPNFGRPVQPPNLIQSQFTRQFVPHPAAPAPVFVSPVVQQVFNGQFGAGPIQPPPQPSRFVTPLEPRELPREDPCFLRFKNRILRNFEERTLAGTALKDCLTICQSSTAFYCASVNYDNVRRICILNGGSAHLNKENLQEAPTDYYENTCNPPLVVEKKEINSIDQGTLHRCFTPIENMILVELDSSVVPETQSLEQCQTECAMSWARRGTQCSALNWMPLTRGCMLFKPSFDRRLLVSSQKGSFYENVCINESFGVRSPSTGANDYYDTDLNH